MRARICVADAVVPKELRSGPCREPDTEGQFAGKNGSGIVPKELDSNVRRSLPVSRCDWDFEGM